MRKINNAPLYGIGEVIDLSYKYGGLPNRIRVNQVFQREYDAEWQYNVTMENRGVAPNEGDVMMSESFIKQRKSKHSSKVYQNNDVQQHMRDGFRFCGNYDSDIARANAKILARRKDITDVRLYPALDYSGRYVNGDMGIWIRYNSVIADNGEIECRPEDAYEKIK